VTARKVRSKNPEVKMQRMAGKTEGREKGDDDGWTACDSAGAREGGFEIGCSGTR
jgi:hypothetical protein